MLKNINALSGLERFLAVRTRGDARVARLPLVPPREQTSPVEPVGKRLMFFERMAKNELHISFEAIYIRLIMNTLMAWARHSGRMI